MRSRNNEDAKGIDVSHWQGTIDWEQVKQAGIAFAFIKATESTGYTDPDVALNFQEAKANNILRGAYHFARPGVSDAAAQVNHFVTVLQDQGDLGELPPVLDLEDTGGLTPEQLVNWVNSWIEEIEAQVQRKPLLYISPNFANQYLTDKLSSVPLWIANWDVSEPGDLRLWKDWTFWQYSNQGSVAGIDGRVDLDVYSGTTENLREKWDALRSEGPSSAEPSPKQSSSGGHSQKASGGGSSSSSPEAGTIHQVLVYGDTGSEVTEIQIKLYQAGLHPGWIDGIFGSDTLQAVRAFQRGQAISVDGIVGPVTWSHMMTQSTVPRPLMMRGSRGQQIRDIQYLLNYHRINPGTVDGIFGPVTEKSVRRYQRSRHIAVDGIVGPNTWHNLLTKLPENKA